MMLGIDTGGTFTDFVLLDGDEVRVHKCLSTPEAPEKAILEGIRAMGLDGRGLRLAHGSTVATNAVLEGKGARTAYVGNAGFQDLLLIGRQNRRRLYDLQPPSDRGPLQDMPRFSVPARLDAEGRELTPLDPADVTALIEALESAGVESVAINLLFSFRDPGHEQRLAEALSEAFNKGPGPGLFISLSSSVLPEYGEYERGMATWLNAYVGPRVSDYIGRLKQALPDSDLKIMQSSGGLMDAANAADRAVHLLLSGPAGGLRGLMAIGRQIESERLLSFDMGGTSSDVAMLDGEIRLSDNGHINAGESSLPVPVPMVDLHTIGAGGGSIAYLDEGGVLRVGPASAGADPGPACYGRGGRQPTVTDANLIMGRIPEGGFGGGLSLDRAAAEQAIQPLAEAMDCDLKAAAQGVLTVVEEAMAGALRVISVERGRDPRDFVLAAFGGAGGLHVCALAERLGMDEALVPVHAGVLSALGMTMTPPTRELSRSLARPLSELTGPDVEAAFADLAEQARAGLVSDGVAAEAIRLDYRVDLRYQGQAHALNLPWSGGLPRASEFHQAHRQAYGHALERPVELVTLRVSAAGEEAIHRLSSSASPSSGSEELAFSGGSPNTRLLHRDAIPLDQPLDGPLRVADAVGTTWVAAGWSVKRDRLGNLRLICHESVAQSR
ncbi:N-methylhydantoinase A [Natronospira proteinivora]|uniref:N-methylhydantoinase A n=1 Tax=Natronospira proteinivora TaxID=1807133 RepID=A0ABT1GB70_9GAMM|nr:hydantoinase/oxoprolinase family protein [Natronospira proteinivora]MCP1728552.1 N-methylhydantoinase A [Natronospira proteinivora]